LERGVNKFEVVCLVLVGERSVGFTMNSRISLSNWGFHKKSTKHGNEGAHRKSVEGYTLIYSHDLIAPREALIKPLEPLLKELQESPPKRGKKSVFLEEITYGISVGVRTMV
jgi:hypothetical protein